MSKFDTEFASHLEVAAARSSQRSLRLLEPAAGMKVTRSGNTLLNFSSNDYLGLSRHPFLIERSREWTARWGAGSAASRLVTGNFTIHQQVEEKLARLKGTEAALIFASGWQANASVLPALLKPFGKKVQMFADRLNHASLHHGCAAAGIRQIRFQHNDLEHLDELLSQPSSEECRRFIVTESVFSMDGDCVDIARLAEIARRHDAFLYLDEAHATGVLGKQGMGMSTLVPGGVDLAMGTFSKAMGGFGAYVAGSRALCEYLLNTSSGFIYSTSLPPGVLGGIDAALDLVPELDQERRTLADMAYDLRRHLGEHGINTGASSSQIIPAVVGSADATMALGKALEEAGLLVTPIRPPTVPEGTARLRIALSALHSADSVEQLAEMLIRLWPRG